MQRQQQREREQRMRSTSAGSGGGGGILGFAGRRKRHCASAVFQQQHLTLFSSAICFCICALTIFCEKAAADSIGPINCYKTNGVNLGIEEVRCAPSLPSSPTYCLKANVYDGRVIRDCASAAQCPQGSACAPITYEEDGTTDFVCCCDDNLCNSAPASLSAGHGNWTMLLALLLMLILMAKYGAHFAM